MNDDTEKPEIPGIVSDLLTDNTAQPDTLVADLWNELQFGQLIKRVGFKKRNGLPMTQVIYLLMIWVWVQADSIGMFANDIMRSFGCKNKDVLYGERI